jgi:hypothetical protein
MPWYDGELDTANIIFRNIEKFKIYIFFKEFFL